MGDITKSSLAGMVATASGQSLAASRAVIEAFIATVREQTAAGNTVKLTGFGSFQVKARPARIGRNPATGELVDIPETTRLTFKASRAA